MIFIFFKKNNSDKELNCLYFWKRNDKRETKEVNGPNANPFLK